MVINNYSMKYALEYYIVWNLEPTKFENLFFLQKICKAVSKRIGITCEIMITLFTWHLHLHVYWSENQTLIFIRPYC